MYLKFFSFFIKSWDNTSLIGSSMKLDLDETSATGLTFMVASMPGTTVTA